MSDGFMAFKGLGLGVAALFAAAAIMPADSQWNPLRLAARSEMQRPSLLKKALRGTDTSGGSTTTTPAPIVPSTSASYPELSNIPSNFNVASELVDVAMPDKSADPEGAFRFICAPGQVLADDPIMFPGQPGRSHLHQFYGNTAANAYSGYESLRTTGQSTCQSPLNRSAYWMPALLDGKGNVVRPDYVAIYYKRRPSNDPLISDPTNPQYQGKGIALPNGLKFIFGWDPTGINGGVKTGAAWFNCDGPT